MKRKRAHCTSIDKEDPAEAGPKWWARSSAGVGKAFWQGLGASDLEVSGGYAQSTLYAQHSR